MKIRLRSWLCMFAIGLAGCDIVSLPSFESPFGGSSAAESPTPTPTPTPQGIRAHCAPTQDSTGYIIACSIHVTGPGFNTGDAANKAAEAVKELGVSPTQKQVDACATQIETEYAKSLLEDLRGKPEIKLIQGEYANVGCEFRR